ncbi:hypothetical protein TNCV_2719481 [Trichonephila clavipes]|nr:hypothetical protein TNCV_2719481 [Trichonephila clavipes]
MADKDILAFFQSDADSDDGNEINSAAPVPTSCEMRNVTKTNIFRITELRKILKDNSIDKSTGCDSSLLGEAISSSTRPIFVGVKD